MFAFSYIWRALYGGKNTDALNAVRVPVYGLVTRYSTGREKLATAEVLKALHEIQLFPSKSQVRLLLESARDSSTHKELNNTLTFGEFCVLVTELRQQKYNQYCMNRQNKMGCVHGSPVISSTSGKTNSGVNGSAKRSISSSRIGPHQSTFEVFLGGACNPTTWRQDIAIPTLKKYGITFYNPQVSEWSPELIEIEERAKESAKLLLFVYEEKTRGIASLVEAAFLSGAERTVFVVMLGVPRHNSEVNGELVSESEFEDLERGQAYLCDLIERQGLPVFGDIPTALLCANKVLKEGIPVTELSPQDGAYPVKQPNGRPGDRLIALREIFNSYDHKKQGQINVDDIYLAVKSATGREDLGAADFDCVRRKCSCRGDTDAIQPINSLSFDEFCCLVTEYSHTWPSFHERGCLSYYLQSLKETANDLCSWLYSKQNNGEIYEEFTPMKRDIFLGGSCSDSTWREDIAIPLLRKRGLTYYNPKKARWSIRYIPLEHEAKEHCRWLLYVVTDTTRGVGSIVEAAHYIGQGRNVILCLQELTESTVVKGEKLSSKAVRDYNRGRKYLADLANRRNVPIFDDVAESVECIINKIQSESHHKP
ncbi:uncharacterized protein [Ptychodera flava]|uniref:uncharacterized protein isoform X2 n=1 Tax=Ptychodera flava TaxID=63121 RepID=UPI00396A1583